MSELGVLFPDEQFVQVGRRRVRVLPVRLRDFEHFGQTAGVALELLGNPSVQAINAFAAQHSRALRRVLYTCTSLSRWACWRLPAMTAFQLFAHVVRVNADFFGHALGALAVVLHGAKSSSDS